MGNPLRDYLAYPMSRIGHEKNSTAHAGRGLREFPYQSIEWLDGDQRQYLTDRDDEYSWEIVERGPEI